MLPFSHLPSDHLSKEALMARRSKAQGTRRRTKFHMMYTRAAGKIVREAHLHDDMQSYKSETDAIFPFPGEAAGHKKGRMLHRKVMWQGSPNAT